MDSTVVNDVGTGLNLVTVIIGAVSALIGLIAGRVHALRKKR